MSPDPANVHRFGASVTSDGVRVILLSLLAVCVLSVPVFCVRFLNDMDYYTLVADKLLRGGVLYRDAIDTKPPLVFFHYALIFKLFGTGNVTAVKIVTMAWLGLSALAMRGIRKELFPSSPRPEFAALLFVLASFSGWGEDFLSSNTEILSNLFVLLGAWCMVKEDFSAGRLRLTLAGVLVGVACLYRYQSGAVLAAYFFTIVSVGKLRFAHAIHRLWYLGIGCLIPIAVLVAYYAWIDGLSDLAFVLKYQSYYLRPHELYWPQVLAHIAIVLVSQAPFLVLAGWQVVRMARQRALAQRDVFLLLFLGFSVWPFFLGSRYFPHYIVQAIPAFVLLATEALSQPVAAAADGLRAFFLRHARTFIVAQAAVFLIVNATYYGLVVADPPKPVFVRFVQEHTNPNDSVFLWTSRIRLLSEIDRTYATRFLSNEFLTGRLWVTRHRLPTATARSAQAAAVPELWPELLGDLRTEQPRMIVDDAPGRSNFTLDHYPALSAFVRDHYEPGRVMDGLRVYLKKVG